MAAMGRRSASVLALLFLAWLSLAFCIGTLDDIGARDGDYSPEDGHHITLWESIQRGSITSLQTALLGALFVYLGFFAGCAWMDTRRKEDDDEWGR